MTRRRKLQVFVVALALPTVGACVSARAATGSPFGEKAVNALNAQREANGIPAGIVERPDWSAACEKHIAYAQRNGTLGHYEDPSKPGYTPEGDWAARTSVLSPGGSWDNGVNPWENAPIHLMQLLGPGLAESGAAQGCMVTWAGYTRPDDGVLKLYSYPGDGQRDWPVEQTASELPYVPGDFVGLPEGTTTGPHIYILASGGRAWGQLTSASVTGPAGQVDIRTVDNKTSDAKGNALPIPSGGIIIPVQPLSGNSTYTVHAAFQTLESSPRTVERTFNFTTAALDPGSSLLVRQGGARRRRCRARARCQPADSAVFMTFRSRAKAPASVQVTRLATGEEAVSTTMEPGSSVRLDLPPGRYRVCADQPAAGAYRGFAKCYTSSVVGYPHLTLPTRAKRTPSGRGLLLSISLDPVLVGQRARVDSYRTKRVCGASATDPRGVRPSGVCPVRRRGPILRKYLVLRPRTRIRLPAHPRRAATYVEIRVERYTIGDATYGPVGTARTYHRPTAIPLRRQKNAKR